MFLRRWEWCGFGGGEFLEMCGRVGYWLAFVNGVKNCKKNIVGFELRRADMLGKIFRTLFAKSVEFANNALTYTII